MHELKELVETQSPTVPENETKRSTSLMLWLALLIIANAIEALLVIFRISLLPSSVPLWASYTLTAVSILIVVSAIVMVGWKKWGFYLFCALEVLAFAVNLIAGAGVFAFIGLIGIAITYLLIRSIWNLFD